LKKSVAKRLTMGNLIYYGTFSQEYTSPKQIIIQSILRIKGFPIHFMTEQHKKIIQWKKGDNKTRIKWTDFTFTTKETKFVTKFFKHAILKVAYKT
jgi:hypothetical protein